MDSLMADKPPELLPKRKPVQKRSQETRSKIAVAARALFSEVGYEKTTTTLIASRAAVSIGTVYAHFNDKRELFLEIINEHLANFLPLLRANIDESLKVSHGKANIIEKIVWDAYEAYKFDGKLNFEMEKFWLKDEKAVEIRAYWYGKYHEELVRLVKALNKGQRIKDLEAAAVVITRTAYAILQSIYLGREPLDEKAVLNEYIDMVRQYVLEA
ncbi:TetR/AcrR family transcriptional regulator [Candidatus Poribacteria bacterium]|nr:TetR/AcrR family transcriptional regulator [Candidatus Poribacteria bacterium]